MPIALTPGFTVISRSPGQYFAQTGAVDNATVTEMVPIQSADAMSADTQAETQTSLPLADGIAPHHNNYSNHGSPIARHQNVPFTTALSPAGLRVASDGKEWCSGSIVRLLDSIVPTRHAIPNNRIVINLENALIKESHAGDLADELREWVNDTGISVRVIANNLHLEIDSDDSIEEQRARGQMAAMPSLELGLSHSLRHELRLEHRLRHPLDGLRSLYDSADKKEFNKFGLHFEYALVSRAQAPYLMGLGTIGLCFDGMIFVVQDFFKDIEPRLNELLCEIVAAHEYGEELWSDHHRATRLELAIAQKMGWLGDYLELLKKNYALKFRDLSLNRLPKFFDEGDDAALPETGFSDDAQCTEILMSESTRTAAALADGFTLPKELKTYKGILDNQNHERLELEAMEEWAATATVNDQLRTHIGSAVNEAERLVRDQIAAGNSSIVSLARQARIKLYETLAPVVDEMNRGTLDKRKINRDVIASIWSAAQVELCKKFERSFPEWRTRLSAFDAAFFEEDYEKALANTLALSELQQHLVYEYKADAPRIMAVILDEAATFAAGRKHPQKFSAVLEKAEKAAEKSLAAIRAFEIQLSSSMYGNSYHTSDVEVREALGFLRFIRPEEYSFTITLEHTRRRLAKACLICIEKNGLVNSPLASLIPVAAARIMQQYIYRSFPQEANALDPLSLLTLDDVMRLGREGVDSWYIRALVSFVQEEEASSTRDGALTELGHKLKETLPASIPIRGIITALDRALARGEITVAVAAEILVRHWKTNMPKLPYSYFMPLMEIAGFDAEEISAAMIIELGRNEPEFNLWNKGFVRMALERVESRSFTLNSGMSHEYAENRRWHELNGSNYLLPPEFEKDLAAKLAAKSPGECLAEAIGMIHALPDEKRKMYAVMDDVLPAWSQVHSLSVVASDAGRSFPLAEAKKFLARHMLDMMVYLVGKDDPEANKKSVLAMVRYFVQFLQQTESHLFAGTSVDAVMASLSQLHDWVLSNPFGNAHDTRFCIEYTFVVLKKSVGDSPIGHQLARLDSETLKHIREIVTSKLCVLGIAF